MRLADFIVGNIEPILIEWEAFARSLLPGANMTMRALRDDAGSILLATARDMENSQSSRQQASKSKGEGGAGGAASDRLDDASESHGVDRVRSGFHITDVVAEYRAMRTSVVRLWRESHPQLDIDDIDDITRFHESLDQSLASAVGSYSDRVDGSRKMFLAILSHDLRNPVNCIRMASYLVSKAKHDPDADEARAAITTSTGTITRLISDLIDFSSSGLGRAMPMDRGPVDLEALSREVVDGFRITHPERTLRFHSDGDVTGVWDEDRIRQVISNLIGNAIQHGSPDGPIELSVSSEGSTPEESTVVLTVHNEGEPIPPDLLPTIFDPLVRYATPESVMRRRSESIGLGLYIVREIVVAKGGTVEIASTEQDGTTFTVRIPRILPAESEKRDDAEAADTEERRRSMEEATALRDAPRHQPELAHKSP